MKNTSIKQSKAYSLRPELRHKQFIYSQHSSKFHLALSCPVNSVAKKVGNRPFSQAAQPEFGLKEKHRSERKGTSKLASCHQAPVWSPFAFLRAIRQQAVIKKGYVFEHSPSPRDECPSLSDCNHFLWARKPQTKACLFLRTSGSAEKEIQHIFMRLSGISCFIIMKERAVSSSQSWNMWHQEMVWCCYSLVWEEECVFLARGLSDDAIQKLVGQYGISRGERQHAVWRTIIRTIMVFS